MKRAITSILGIALGLASVSSISFADAPGDIAVTVRAGKHIYNFDSATVTTEGGKVSLPSYIYSPQFANAVKLANQMQGDLSASCETHWFKSDYLVYKVQGIEASREKITGSCSDAFNKRMLGSLQDFFGSANAYRKSENEKLAKEKEKEKALSVAETADLKLKVENLEKKVAMQDLKNGGPVSATQTLQKPLPTTSGQEPTTRPATAGKADGGLNQ